MQRYFSLLGLLFDYGPGLFAKRVQLSTALRAWDKLPEIKGCAGAIGDLPQEGGVPYDLLIPVYGELSIVAPLLERLLSSPPVQAQRIVFIDDGTGDKALTKALKHFVQNVPKAKLVVHDSNMGFSKAVATGMEGTDQDLVLVLNSDTIPPDGSLDRLMGHFSHQPQLAAICPLSNQAIFAGVADAQQGAKLNVDQLDALNLALQSRDPIKASYQVPYACGFCWGVRRSVWDQLGGFDSAFASGYGEEADFCLRALAHGYESRVASDCAVYHAHGQSFKQARVDKERRSSMELLRRHPEFLRLASSSELLQNAQIARTP